MPPSTSHSSESQASPRAPISPFSLTSASDSHYTSEDLPDLGAFNTVLREWVYLQPPLRIPQYHGEPSTASGSTVLTQSTDTDAEATGRRSTVWNHQPIAEYLASESDGGSDADTGETDTEGAMSVEIETVIDDDIGDRATPLEDGSVSSLPLDSLMLSPLQTQPSLDDSSAKDPELDEVDVAFQPSLGYLDEALNFIAAERARLDAQRTAGVGTASPDAWKHVIEPRRRRRRRRPGKGSSTQPLASPMTKSTLFSTSDNEQGINSEPYATTLDKDDDSEDDDENDNNSNYNARPVNISKSTPMTPRPRIPSPSAGLSINIASMSSDSNDFSASLTSPGFKVKSSRKRTRSKHPAKQKKLLTRPRSTSDLHSVAEGQPLPHTPKWDVFTDPDTQRLVTLTRYLGHIRPNERAQLAGVEKKLALASRAKQKEMRKAARLVEVDVVDPDLYLDPRGRVPRAFDPPVHVFIDHSNILFGLLTYLKRHPPPTFRNTRGIYNIKPVQSPSIAHKTTTATPIPLPSFATAARSLHLNTITSPTTESVLTPHTSEGHAFVLRNHSSLKSNPKSKAGHGSTPASNILPSSSSMTAPIPIPISISTSATSDDILLLGNTYNILDGNENKEEKEVEDGVLEDKYDADYVTGDDEVGDEDDPSEVQSTPNRRPARHLSHTALTLILERGRPITRRVVVTSSPLYQPMDTLERLGYEVRVYLRVPDLGDGMDRKEKHVLGKSNSGASANRSPKKGKGHVRYLSGNTSAESAGTATSPGASFREGEIRSARNIAPPIASSTFPQPISSTLASPSTPTSNTETLTSTPPLNLATPLTPLHPHYFQYLQHHQAQGQNNTTGAIRIRYREQGVDELLQLKLHQALAATDDVPEGATIVLATGDGNVGQFNEDGFLGPVRTALKRGWKVELYAWEDGLSRAWRREFGVGSEWARNGMFQIIGMEQFAASLVKGGLL